MNTTKVELNRLRTEIAMAQRIQLNLLPNPAPVVAGLDVAAIIRPGFHVGGDFYDFFLDSNRLFTFIISDICGRGLSAALMVGMTRLVLRMVSNHKARLTPEEIFSQSNEILYEDFSRTTTFASAFIGQYDPTTQTMIYANAGHSPVIFIPAGEEARLLIADGAPLGVLPSSASKNQYQRINSGDLLVLGTDGLAETYSGRGNLWTGYQILLKETTRLAHLPAQSIAESLFNPIQGCCEDATQNDDQTLVVIKCT